MTNVKKYDENLIVSIHQNTKRVVKKLGETEWELIHQIQQVIQHEVFRKYGYPNIKTYLVLAHGLTKDRAYDYASVARASLKFDKLESALINGGITVSKARRIVPVLDQNNQEDWILKAHTHSQKNLERLVASKNPDVAFDESARYISANQVEVKIIMSVSEYEESKRTQNLLCQKRRKTVSMKDTIVHTNREFLNKEDPLTKAIRHQAAQLKKAVRNTQNLGARRKNPTIKIEIGRRPIPSQVQHQVNLRDKRQCGERLPNGEKCQESRWIDIHHIKPVSQGGDNSLQNLITLCKDHHQLEHSQ